MRKHKKFKLVAGFLFFAVFIALPIFGSAAHQDDETAPNIITAAVLNDFPPLYMLDEAGTPKGFAVDILTDVAKTTGLTVKYIVVDNWDEAMQAVESGKADLVPGIGIDQQRLSKFLFTAEIETIPVSIFVRHKNFSIEGIESLQGHKAAVIEKSAAETKLQNFKGIEVLSFHDIETALFQLLAGEVDAFVFPEPVLWDKARSIGVEDKIKVVGKPLMELKRGFMLHKSNTALLNKLNPAIIEHTRSVNI
ncbi:Extracellular solute-binding protein, family 3 [Candidatus Magnetoovum chiemensis]|nr:Extracellular solute-binding protein, family 3 [Candidatus Magnetoovum chiemensis]